VVIEDLMAENVELQEWLRKVGIGGWWEVDVHQLLKVVESCHWRLDKRTGGGKNQFTLHNVHNVHH